MSKHTPGPWETGILYYPKDGSIGSCDISQVGEMGIFATVYLPAKGRSAHLEGPANAHLIAAAPEMLEALKLISSNWPEKRDGMDGDGPLPVGVRSVRAAIAKAEGKL